MPEPDDLHPIQLHATREQLTARLAAAHLERDRYRAAWHSAHQRARRETAQAATDPPTEGDDHP